MASISMILAGALSANVLAQTRTVPSPKVQVEVDGVYLATSQTLRSTAAPQVNAESAQFSITHEIPSSFGFGASGGYRIWKRLGLGAAFSHNQSSSDASVTGGIPHPFAFNRLRQIQGSSPGLSRTENALAIQARTVAPLSPRIYLTAFVGPALMMLKQDVVVGIDYSESYPYDTASFRSASVTTENQSKWGVSGGVDLSYFASRHAGFGVAAKFSSASFTLPAIYAGTVDSSAGGFQLGVGARFRY